MTTSQPTLPPTPVLETRRLILRPLRQDDAPVIQRRFAQWEVVRYLAAHIPWPYPENGAASHMAQSLGQMARGEKCLWAIVPKGGRDELIGRIDLWPDDGVSRDQRGFWLDPAFAGRGLMTEAAERVTICLRRTRLAASMAEQRRSQRSLRPYPNGASGRIKEKQGARLIDREPSRYVSGEGTRMVWLLTREEWLARRADV